MPAPRNAPTRSSQRRNSQQDDTPTRTRAARGTKPAPSKSDAQEIVPPKASPTKLSPTMTRKTTRSASNISGNSFEAAPEIYASYEDPLLMVFGLSREFFDGLKKHHGKLPKERKVIVSSLQPSSSTLEEASESEDELSHIDDPLGESDGEEPARDRGDIWRGRAGRRKASESEDEISLLDESDELVVPQSTSRGGRGRGRGGRGSRGGGRARGSRGRGRGGRGRGGAARTTSPLRTRPSRNAAPMFPLTEEDDDQPSNQTTPNLSAKPPLHLYRRNHSFGALDDDYEEAIADDDRDAAFELLEHMDIDSVTPGGSPPPGLHESILNGTYAPAPAPEPDPKPVSRSASNLKIPRISFQAGSASQTPRDSASTPAESAVPKLLDPEDDLLSDSDLPEPWIEDAPSPMEMDCEDRADYLLQKRFKPMPDVHALITALTKFPTSQRSTDSLYALAENTQRILRAWQDEYLVLDAKTAPHMHPAKKACNGGRIPIAPEVFEDMKEADLYGYTYDPKKLPGCQDPFAQRPGAEKSGGRELRTRRTRDMLDSAAASEEEDEDNEGRPAKRQRKATRKFDGTDTGTGANTPKRHNGWGGARKKGVSRFSQLASETPEPESRPAKRARVAAINLLHQRIQEMREDSVGGSSGDEGSSAMDVDEYSDTNPKRGRPAGSKNLHRRSDYGIKKGPRKKPSEAATPASSAVGVNAPPLALNSMSEGQGQFTIDPQPPVDTPALAPNSAETVFQATPQSTSTQEVPLVHPSESSTPDAYMTTAPLSQYTNNYVEDTSPASGSRRKPRVKSEKRSQSMTIWWAERKARKREQDEKNGTPVKTPTSRSNSSSRRGGRGSGGPLVAANPTPVTLEPQQMSPTHHAQPNAPPPEVYPGHYAQQQHNAPAPHYVYVSAPPPHPMMLQYSPLAALPSGTFPSYSAPPPSTSQFGPRALAPAPVSLQQVPTYPSPYGPQSPASNRPKSSGQPPRTGPPALAPAPPQHFSPYAPVGLDRQMPFKVMVPGPAPGEPRRESR